MSTNGTAAAAQASTNAAASTPAAASSSTVTPPAQAAAPAVNAAATSSTDPLVTATASTPAVSAVPEKYDLKLPEKFVLDASHTEKISAYAKSKGLSNDQAQEILNRDNDIVSEFHSNQLKALEQRQAQWLESSMKDREIGGDNLKQNVELSKRVLEKFGTDGLKAELQATRFGDHPEVVRFLARLGKAMGEDKFIHVGAVVNEKKSIAERLYPNHNQKKE